MRNIVSKEIALRLWKAAFGDALWVQNCFGAWMYREDYGKRGKLRDNRPGSLGRFYSYGWVVDLILPTDMFQGKAGALFWNNLEPMHYVNAKAKGDRTRFVIGNKKYLVVKCSICAAKDQVWLWH